MEKKKTNKAPLKPWPYVTGKPVDGKTALSAIKFCLATVGMLVAFLFLGAMMMWNNLLLRVLLNAVLLLFGYVIFWQSGLNAGTGAVNRGEILYQRQATGRENDAREIEESYHPMKGFIVGLLGSIPLFLCALGLALTAQRVMSTAGALPGWLATLERREEIGNALVAYHQSVSMSVTDILRLIIRMALMPLVNIIGGENKEGLLLLERVSPLLVLIPGLCYGVGYRGGVWVRTRVHADIEKGKRRIKRRQKRERQQRSRPNKGPEQLN